jgi:hypothetical protein
MQRCLVLFAAALLAGCAAKQPAPSLLSVATATESTIGPGVLTESSVVSTAATVVAIDQRTRMVTLRAPDGRLHTIRVDPSVRNLSHVCKGDEVVATATSGQKPAVVEIDRKHRTVDLRGPAGNVTTIDVHNPAHLTDVRVGDMVELSVTEALAVQVEKAPKR